MRALVSVGFGCNNRCVFCAQGDLRTGAEGRVPDDEVRARIAAARPAEALTLAGGEPTTRPELTSWATFAREKGFSTVQVQTNGRRLSYRRYAAELARAGVDDLDVSLHGPEARIHDWHVRVEGAFDQTKAGIAHARAEGMSVGVTTVITRSSFRHLADVARIASSLGAERIHFAAALPRGAAEAAFDSVVPRFALLEAPLGEALDVAARLGMRAIVSGVPACFLGGHRSAFTHLHGDVVFAHGRPCAVCSWKGSCPGAPAAYAARLGDGELHPRSDSPPAAFDTHGFAGPGAMEDVRPDRLADRPPPADVAQARLRDLGKPAPGLYEIRIAKKRTGEALEEIFPALFEKP